MSAAAWYYENKPDDIEAIFGASLTLEDNGRFLLYKRKPEEKGEFVLHVAFKTKNTRHLVVLNSNNNLQVGKLECDGCTTAEQLVAYLSAPGVKGWPVPLTEAAKLKLPVEADTSNNILDSDAPMEWLHEDIDREQASKLVGEIGKDGAFLVSPRSQTDQYALCVWYKGRPTHHLVSKNSEGVMAVNKKTYGNTGGLANLIALLGKPDTPGWPVPLVYPVTSIETNTSVDSPSNPEPQVPPPIDRSTKSGLTTSSLSPSESTEPNTDPQSPPDVDRTTKTSSPATVFDKISNAAQGLSNHMITSRPKSAGRPPSMRPSLSSSDLSSSHGNNIDEASQNTDTKDVVVPAVSSINPDTTKSVDINTVTADEAERVADELEAKAAALEEKIRQMKLKKQLREDTPAIETPGGFTDPDHAVKKKIEQWLKDVSDKDDAHVDDSDTLDRSLLSRHLLECAETIEAKSIDGVEILAAINSQTESLVSKPEFLRIARDADYRADLRVSKFKQIEAEKRAKALEAKRAAEEEEQKRQAVENDRKHQEEAQAQAQAKKMEKMPQWKLDMLKAEENKPRSSFSEKDEEPAWKKDLKVNVARKKRSNAETSSSPTSPVPSAMSNASSGALMVFELLVAINEGKSTIPVKSKIPSTVACATLREAWDLAKEEFLLPPSSRLERYLDQSDTHVSLKAFESVVAPVIKSATRVRPTSPATISAVQTTNPVIFVRRDIKDLQEREKLEQQNADREAAIEAAKKAKQDAIEDEKRKEMEKKMAQQEEDELLATMPSWKRELYLRDKGSISGHRKAKRQSIQMVSSVQTLLQKQREKLANEELIAEEKASIPTDSAMVNKAWDRLSTPSRNIQVRRPSSPQPDEDAQTQRKTRRQTLMEDMLSVINNTGARNAPLNVPAALSEEEAHADNNNVDSNPKSDPQQQIDENELTALELEKRASDLEAVVVKLKEKKAAEMEQKAAAALKIQAGFRGSLGRKKAKAVRAQLEAQKIQLAEREAELQRIMQEKARIQHETILIQKQHLLRKMQNQQELAEKTAEWKSQQSNASASSSLKTKSKTRKSNPPRSSSDDAVSVISGSTSLHNPPRRKITARLPDGMLRGRTPSKSVPQLRDHDTNSNTGMVASMQKLPGANAADTLKFEALQRIRMKSQQQTDANLTTKAEVLEGSGVFIVEGCYLDASGTFAADATTDEVTVIPKNFKTSKQIKMLHKKKSFAAF